MSDSISDKSAEPCLACGRLMELVHFNCNGAGLLVLHGPPPAGLAARLLEPITARSSRPSPGHRSCGPFGRGTSSRPSTARTAARSSSATTA